MTDLLDVLINSYDLKFVPEDITEEQVMSEAVPPAVVLTGEDVKDSLLVLQQRISDILLYLTPEANARYVTVVNGKEIVLPTADEYSELCVSSCTFDDVERLRAFEIYHLEEGNPNVFIYLDAVTVANELENTAQDEAFLLASATQETSLEDPMVRLKEYFTMRSAYAEQVVDTIEVSAKNPLVDELEDFSLKELGDIINNNELSAALNTRDGSTGGADMTSLGYSIGLSTQASAIVEGLRSTRTTLTRIRSLVLLMQKDYVFKAQLFIDKLRQGFSSILLAKINAIKAKAAAVVFQETIRPLIEKIEQKTLQATNIPIIRKLEEEVYDYIFDYLLKLQHELANLSASDKEESDKKKARIEKIADVKRCRVFIKVLDKAIMEIDRLLNIKNPLTDKDLSISIGGVTIGSTTGS